MVLYVCEVCKYSTKRKADFNKHLKRKNPCIPQDTLKELEKSLPPENSGFPPENSGLPPENSGKINTIEKKVFECHCIYCGNEFKRKDNLTRHLKNRCPVLKNHMAQLDETNKKNEEILKNKINDLQLALINKPTTNITTFNTVNNVKINNYGNENLEYLTIQGVNKLIEAPYTAIPNIIKTIHYNPEHPENNNMKITNKRDPYIRLLEDNKWKIDNKKKVINSLIDKGKIILDKYRDSDMHTDFKNICYEQFSEQLEKDDKVLIKQMINDLELLILNNS